MGFVYKNKVLEWATMNNTFWLDREEEIVFAFNWLEKTTHVRPLESYKGHVLVTDFIKRFPSFIPSISLESLFYTTFMEMVRDDILWRDRYFFLSRQVRSKWRRLSVYSFIYWNRSQTVSLLTGNIYVILKILSNIVGLSRFKLTPIPSYTFRHRID